MNGNKKSAKQYHQSVITALEKKVNDMKDSAYSGLYSEIAFIIGIAVIMIDTFFPPEETKVNCVWKIILIAVSIVCMLYFAKKVKTVNEVEEEKKFWPNFFILSPRMKSFVKVFQAFFSYVSIDLRGGEVGMTQQLLHTTKIAARLQHMRSERVT